MFDIMIFCSSRLLYPHTTKLLGIILVSLHPSVRPSVCPSFRPASRVRSVVPTVLVGSISYLYILSSNFRRCVACKVSCKIWIFGNFLKFVTLTLSCFWPAHCAGLLRCNFFGQPGSVSKFPPFLWVKLWVGWVGRGYIEISRYFPTLWINRVTLVTKIKLWYSVGY